MAVWLPRRERIACLMDVCGENRESQPSVRWRFRLAAISISTLLALSILGCESTKTPGVPAAESNPTADREAFRLLDPTGVPVDPFLDDAAALVVFVFTRTDCPISNRYAPEVRRIAEEFTPRGVRFWLIYPNPSTTPLDIRRHLLEYDYPCEALADPNHRLVALTGAQVTPEATVFDRQRRLVYRGRIDDRFIDFGKARPEPTERSLKDAIDALLAGRPVARVITQAVGCPIADLK